jgi:hypothetical protein
MTSNRAIYSVGFGFVMLALIGLVVGFSSPKAPGTTVQQAPKAWVDDDDPTCGGNSPCFQKIQAAIDAIQLEPYQSGTVYIRPGLYREHVQITKNVELQGAGRELVRLEAPDATKPAILVKGIFVSEISGLGIYNGLVGILVEDAKVFAIKYNRIAGYTEAGIRLVRSEISSSIIYNELPDSMDWDVRRESPGVSVITGTAIDILEGSRATIQLNLIRSFIQIRGKSQVTPLGEGKSYANIMENRLNNVLVSKNGAASITRNQFSPDGSSTVAVMLWPGAETTILANQIQGYGIGINIAADSQADIQNNLIFGNGVGIVTGLPIRYEPAPPPKFRIMRNRIIGNEWGLILYEGQGLFAFPRAEVKYNWISENGGYQYIYPGGDDGGVQFGRQVRLDFSNNFVINNYYGICPYLNEGEDIDPEALRGSNNEIRDNISDLCNADTSYPWPPGFRK